MNARLIDTDRLRVSFVESGPEDGIPVVLIHGNLSTGRFYEHLMPGAPGRYRLIAPDMRGFGDTERKPIDATRGLRDWADDTHALLRALGIERAPHLVGWSTGGAAIAAYALDRPVASLTFVDPVSPSYWRPDHELAPEHEEMLLGELLKSQTGDDGYPGDSAPSENWPGIAPGTRGILNALSPKYCNWSGIVDLDPRPPVLWTHGTADIVVADGSPWEMGTLGQLGLVPGWPGEERFPPQPMVTQIRTLLEEYRARGGRAEMEMFEGSGHFPPMDAQERWSELFFGFLASVG